MSAATTAAVLSAVPGDRIPQRLLSESVTVVLARAYYVHERCSAAPTRHFICLSCAQYLANEYQLELHSERGAHVVARLCPEHGAEPIDQ